MIVLISPVFVLYRLLDHTTAEATIGAMHGRNTIIRKKLLVLLLFIWLISVAMVREITMLRATATTVNMIVFLNALTASGSSSSSL